MWGWNAIVLIVLLGQFWWALQWIRMVSNEWQSAHFFMCCFEQIPSFRFLVLEFVSFSPSHEVWILLKMNGSNKPILEKGQKKHRELTLKCLYHIRSHSAKTRTCGRECDWASQWKREGVKYQNRFKVYCVRSLLYPSCKSIVCLFGIGVEFKKKKKK